MTGSWNRDRHSAEVATQILLEVLQNPFADDSRLIQAYLDSKRQLARAFRSFAQERVDEPDAIRPLIGSLEASMAALYPDVPSQYRQVRGFGAAHRLLYAYLATRFDNDVPLDELRILTGDAVHTERRLRELRYLGAEIVMVESGGMRTCRLSKSVDLHSAARAWILRSIANDKSLKPSEAQKLSGLLEL